MIEGKKPEEVIRELEDWPDILEIYETLEPYDILIKVRTTDIHTLKSEIIDKITELEGVIEVRSILTTRRHKERTTNLIGKRV